MMEIYHFWHFHDDFWEENPGISSFCGEVVDAENWRDEFGVKFPQNSLSQAGNSVKNEDFWCRILIKPDFLIN